MENDYSCITSSGGEKLRLPLKLGLNKAMKLRHRSLVNDLYSNGKNSYAYPLRMVWRTLSNNELQNSFSNHVPCKIARLQFMITVPKKKQRHAVDRVIIRRRIREAFRKLRPLFDNYLNSHPEVRTLQLGFIYISENKENYHFIEEKLHKLILSII